MAVDATVCRRATGGAGNHFGAGNRRALRRLRLDGGDRARCGLRFETACVMEQQRADAYRKN